MASTLDHVYGVKRMNVSYQGTANDLHDKSASPLTEEIIAVHAIGKSVLKKTRILTAVVWLIGEKKNDKVSDSCSTETFCHPFLKTSPMQNLGPASRALQCQVLAKT